MDVCCSVLSVACAECLVCTTTVCTKVVCNTVGQRHCEVVDGSIPCPFCSCVKNFYVLVVSAEFDAKVLCSAGSINEGQCVLAVCKFCNCENYCITSRFACCVVVATHCTCEVQHFVGKVLLNHLHQVLTFCKFACYFVAWALVCASRVCAFFVKTLSACWANAFALVFFYWRNFAIVVCFKLASKACGDVAEVGTANCVVCSVCTNVVLVGTYCQNKCFVCFVVGVYFCRSRCCEFN